MRIGEAAAAAGTTPRALRLYEARGLLPPSPRTPSGQREYSAAAVARVRVIRDLLALGLTLEDIRRRAHRLDLLVQDPPAACGRRPGGFSDVVADRLATLDAEIARLTRLRQSLAAAAETPDSPAARRRGAPEPAPERAPAPES
ncbi:MerR family transcriptional regulator [Streptomyces sp. V4-01]|uniref:MerR family transcriptional regulator n=1 Tax=Actinacidiphila polyblastidii TaxID=3110430 RepID=A0ABU7PKH5_9ACTN|nr:MerR family transcriptional regulator [Streptomyces sp. V4-01]